MPWLGRSLRLAETFSRAAVWAGGALTLGAVFLIAYDILVRKFFNITVGGADEISSYVFAISTSWALAFVVLQRANVRVDVIYERLPVRVSAFLDWLSLVALGVLCSGAAYILYFRLIAQLGPSRAITSVDPST